MNKPKGVLIAIGGREDKEGSRSILKRVIKETHRRNPVLEIVTAASNEHRQLSDEYIEVFKEMGVKNVREMYVEDREHASSASLLARIKESDCIFICGGNQLKLTTLLGGTRVLSLIKDRYHNEEHYVVAGTSAGAAAMSNTMIVSGSSEDALVKGELQLTNGLNFIGDVFIDTHVTQRGRFGRLMQTVAANPSTLGLGLSEDSAVVITDSKLEAIGRGLVTIFDGIDITYTDLTDIEEGDPITIEGMRVHVLGDGKRFLLKERELMKSSKR